MSEMDIADSIGYTYRQSGLNSGREFTILPRNSDKIVFLQLEELHLCILFSRIYQRQISEIHPSQAKVSGKVKGLTAAV